MASVCSTIANFAMITNGSKTRFSTKDFLLEFKTVTKEDTKVAAAQPNQDWKRLKMIAMMYAAASHEDAKKQNRRKGRSK